MFIHKVFSGSKSSQQACTLAGKLGIHGRDRAPLSFKLQLRWSRDLAPPITCTRRSAILDKHMIVVNIDEPVYFELILLRPTATATRQVPTWRRVDGEREQILRFDEVSHEPTSNEEIDETEDIHGANKSKDDVKDALPWLRTPGGVILGLKGRLECLILRLFQRWYRGGIVPVVDEWRILSAYEKGAARQNSQRFCYRR